MPYQYVTEHNGKTTIVFSDIAATTAESSQAKTGIERKKDFIQP